MANRFKGECALEVGEKTYTLRFGANEIVALEDELGKGVAEIGQMLSAPDYQPTMKEARMFVWLALQAHHPDVTLLQAGEIINEAGVVEAFSATMTALNNSFPEKQAGKVTEGKAPSRGRGRA